MTSRSCTLLLALLAGGCLGPRAPQDVRHYAPILPDRVPIEDSRAAGEMLRLRRVRAASSIRERILWRLADGEVGYFELARWVEPPVDVLARSLARVLFEERGLRRSESPMSPALDVELSAFELVLGERPAARARIVAELYGQTGGEALLVRTFERSIEVSQARPGPELSQALGAALAALADELADATLEVLERIEPGREL